MGKEDLKYSEQEIIDLGWKRLDEVLDKRAPRKPRFIWWWFPILVVLVGGSYFLIKGISDSGDGERVSEFQKTEDVSMPMVGEGEMEITPISNSVINGPATDSGKTSFANTALRMESEKDGTSAVTSTTNSALSEGWVETKQAAVIGEKQVLPETKPDSGLAKVKKQPQKRTTQENRARPISQNAPKNNELGQPGDKNALFETELDSQNNSSLDVDEAEDEVPVEKRARPKVSVQVDDIGDGTEPIQEAFDSTGEPEVDSPVGVLGQPEGEELVASNELPEEGAEDGEGSLEVKSLSESGSGVLFGEVSLISNSYDNLGFGGGLQYKTPLGERGSWALGLQLSSIKESFGQSVNYESALADSIATISNGLDQKVSVFELSVPATYQYKIFPNSELVVGVVGAYQKMTETSNFSADDFQALDNSGGQVVTNSLTVAISDLLPDDQLTIASKIGINQNVTNKIVLSGNLTKTFSTGNNILNYTPTQLGLSLRLKLTDQ